jgi:hypothetical protein
MLDELRSYFFSFPASSIQQLAPARIERWDFYAANLS